MLYCVRLYVCVGFSAHKHISPTARPIFTKFLCMLPIAVARSSAGVVIRCVLPVLSMTSYLHIMGICTAQMPVGAVSLPDCAASQGQWPRWLGLRAVAESACRAFLNQCAMFFMPYDTRCYFNVRSKADMSQLNLPHGNDS